MIQCTNCSEWFHEECVQVEEKVWEEPDCKWSCDNCMLLTYCVIIV